MPSKLTLLVYELRTVVVVGNPRDPSEYHQGCHGEIFTILRLDRADVGDALFFALLAFSEKNDVPFRAEEP